MTEGIIVKVNNGIYTVRHDKGNTVCKPKGKFRIGDIVPVAGDRCIIEGENMADGGVICEILPRKNSLIRPKLANIDNLLIVFAATNPEPQLDVINTLTATAEQKGIKPIIIITKSDISLPEKTEEYRRIYESAGYKVIVTSIDDRQDISPLLQEELSGKVTAVAGNSGVGKSTFLNKLFGFDDLLTGEISHKNKKGKHTTTVVELFEKFGGFVADTPGFNSLDIFDIECRELENLFPEIKSRLGFCRFSGCSHISEPDCPVKEAFENGEIMQQRFDTYVKLYNQIKNRKKF